MLQVRSGSLISSPAAHGEPPKAADGLLKAVKPSATFPPNFSVTDAIAEFSALVPATWAGSLRRVRGFVFDAGAFIALERRAPLLLGILDEALHGTIQIVLPRTVIAQVWRGGPRQANVGRLISAGRGSGGPVIIDELTAQRAKEIGVTIGKISHPDIVDVHVALAAAERGHAVLTSDDADITAVGLDLVLVHV